MTGRTPRRGRISASEVRQLRSRLSQRDLAILAAVEALRLLQATEVQRAIFTSGSELTRARRARSTLQRLTEAGLLARLSRRIGGVRAGSAGYIYTLTPFGQRVLHPNAKRLRRVREPGSAFVDHVLAVAELWTRLHEATRAGSLRLVEFQAEPACWRRPEGGVSGFAVKPDAHVVVETGDWELHWFIEVDLGTESVSVIRRKADSYVRYWHTGTELHATGVFPRVLFTVPDEHRREKIVDTLSRVDPEAWQL